MLHCYFWSGAAMYVSLWLNTVASCSDVFYWAYFCFIHDVILKEDGNNIKGKQTPLSFKTQQTDFENCFFWECLFQRAFLQQTSGCLPMLNTLFCLLRRPQPQKMCPSTLVVLNIFETNTVNSLWTVLCRVPRQTVSCD